MKKSQSTGIILTMLLGPWGLMYSNKYVALVYMVLLIITVPTIVIPVFLWVLSIPTSIYCVKQHNDDVEYWMN